MMQDPDSVLIGKRRPKAGPEQPYFCGLHRPSVQDSAGSMYESCYHLVMVILMLNRLNCQDRTTFFSLVVGLPVRLWP